MAAGVAPGMITAVLLTHLHSDHITDFNDVITSRWIAEFEPAQLPLVGPPGTGALADATLEMLRPDIGYRLAHHEDLDWEPGIEATELESGIAWDEAGVRILAAPTDHRPVHPTVGYRVEHDGAVVAIAGDTVPCDGLTALCDGADIYVQTVIRPSLVEAIPVPRLQDILDYHSSVEDAARTAAAAGVGTLVLNHCVPTPVPGTEHEWIDEAAAHFDGTILMSHDLLEVAT